MYNFVLYEYKIHPKIDKKEMQWFLVIETQEEFDRFIEGRTKELLRQYNWLKDRDVDGNGKTRDQSHVSNADALIIWNILSLDDTRKTVMDDIKHIDNLLIGYRKIFEDKHHILINSALGCCFKDDSFTKIDSKITEKMNFPISDNGYKIVKWPQGRHYYISVYGRGYGSINLPEKYNSEQEAERVAKKSLKEYLIKNGDR